LLPATEFHDLFNLADPIIRQTLTAMPPRRTPSGRLRRLEIQALKQFLFVAAPAIARAWKARVPLAKSMRLTSVFCHQTPMASWQMPVPGYGFTSQLNAWSPPPWTCELADLLVVMEFGGQGQSLDHRQAGLVQGKQGKYPVLPLQPGEFRQHHLLSCLPPFHLSGTGTRLWQLQGLASGAARYGLIDPPSGTWTINRPNPRGTLPFYAGRSMGHWLAQLATDADGAVADLPGTGRTTGAGPHSPPDWPYLVDHLLTVTGQKAIAGRGQRRQSHVIRFLDTAALAEEDIAAGPIESWMRIAEVWDKDSPPPDTAPSEGETSGFGVIHIRFGET
jgi:hypothetical protein